MAARTLIGLAFLLVACSHEPAAPDTEVSAAEVGEDATRADEPASEEPPTAEAELEEPAWTEAHQLAFDGLLASGRMQLDLPDGFHLAPGEDHPALPYEARLVETDGDLEVRISVRPLADIEIDYQDAHSSAPEPNHSFGMFFRAVMERLSPKGLGTERELSYAACEPYGATWGMVATLDLRPEFFPEHEQALLLTLHREHAADAYLLFLTPDMQADKPRIVESLEVLTFIDPTPALPGSEPQPESVPEDSESAPR